MGLTCSHDHYSIIPFSLDKKNFFVVFVLLVHPVSALDLGGDLNPAKD